MKYISTLIVGLLFAMPAAGSDDLLIYDVQFSRVRGVELRSLTVMFHGKPPANEVIERIVSESLQHAILIDDSTDILASAADSEDNVIGGLSWGKHLKYDAKQKKVAPLPPPKPRK